MYIFSAPVLLDIHSLSERLLRCSPRGLELLRAPAPNDSCCVHPWGSLKVIPGTARSGTGSAIWTRSSTGEGDSRLPPRAAGLPFGGALGIAVPLRVQWATLVNRSVGRASF